MNINKMLVAAANATLVAEFIGLEPGFSQDGFDPVSGKVFNLNKWDDGSIRLMVSVPGLPGRQIVTSVPVFKEMATISAEEAEVIASVILPHVGRNERRLPYKMARHAFLKVRGG